MNFRTLLSPLLSRAQFAAALAGYTFLGNRDLYAALGYKRVLTTQDFRSRYDRDGISARIVDAFPKATWRGVGELVEDEDPQTLTEFEQAFDDLNKKFKLWQVFMRADILAGLGRYSVILIGAPGELDQELPKGKPETLLYFTPFGEDDATIESLNMDTTNPRFGLPVFYNLKRTSNELSSFSRRVHWSRVIHIVDTPLDDEIYGAPRLQKPWNRLDDLEKVSGGGSEAFWVRANQGIQFNLDKDTELSPTEIQKLKDETDEFVNGMRRIVRTRGMEMNALGSDVANFAAPADAILTQIAGGLGIPKRILMGSEMGQLASSQDRSNWRDQVQDRRDAFAAPAVVRPLVDRLIEHGYLPQPKQYDVSWPTIQFLDESERGELALKWAQVNAQYKGEVVITPDEIRDVVLGLEPLEIRQEALVQPAPELEPITELPPGFKAAPPKPQPVLVGPGGQKKAQPNPAMQPQVING